MKEAQFSSELIRSFKDHGHWAYKIPDLPRGHGAAGLRFNPAKPFDIVAMVAGYGLAIECKQIKEFKAFGMSQMRDCQVEALDSICDSGSGFTYVFLNIRIPRTENRLVVFDWQYFRSRCSASGSFKKKEIEEMPYIQGRLGKFDLSSFLEGFVDEEDAGTDGEGIDIRVVSPQRLQ